MLALLLGKVGLFKWETQEEEYNFYPITFPYWKRETRYRPFHFLPLLLLLRQILLLLFICGVEIFVNWTTLKRLHGVSRRKSFFFFFLRKLVTLLRKWPELCDDIDAEGQKDLLLYGRVEVPLSGYCHKYCLKIYHPSFFILKGPSK